jgi:adenosine kinase
VILSGGKAITVPAAPVDAVVDTTGAGDLYAAGFLYGVAKRLPLETAGKLGSLAAAEVISHVGARPQVSLRDLAQRSGLLA